MVINDKATPPEVSGYVTISQEAFFATVGRLDVAPRAVGDYDPIFGYRSHWKLNRGGELVGVSAGGTCHSHHRFMVSPQFFDANRDAIEKANA